jgi:hypothetical protein
MKLNLGCGYNQVEGYINVDNDPNCNPDIVADLEAILPFADSSVDEIIMQHILEHLGQDTKTYLSVWKELYRILKDQGVIRIVVPHHLHENFFHDPTHCRVVTPVGIDMFSQERNMNTIATGGSETTLGLQLAIDIGVTELGYDLMPEYEAEYRHAAFHVIEKLTKEKPGACYQVRINAKAHKPPRSTTANQ